jgi:hypothetical protein
MSCLPPVHREGIDIIVFSITILLKKYNLNLQMHIQAS